MYSNFTANSNGDFRLLNPSPKSIADDIPEEIWGNIFRFILCPHERINEIGKENDDIWDFRRVCTKWRNAIDYTSSFWCRWGISTQLEVKYPCLESRIHLCLKNSRNLPLSISLAVWMREETEQKVFRLIKPHLFRCVHLGIHTPTLVFACRDSDDKPNLCNISSLSLYGKYLTSSVSPVLRELTALQEVSIEGGHIIDLDLPPQLKKLSIIKCRVEYSQEETIRCILVNTPLLEDFAWLNNEMCTCQRLGRLSRTETPIALRSLHTFHLEEKRYIPDFCRAIQVPSLTNLKIRNRLNSYFIDQTLRQLAENSKFSIKRLQLLSSPNTGNLDWLGQDYFRDVEELSLVGPSLSKTFTADILGALQQDTTLLPSLQKIEIVDELFSISSVIAFMEHRCAKTSTYPTAATPLKCIKLPAVSTDYKYQQTVLDKLKSLGNKLDVEVLIGMT